MQSTNSWSTYIRVISENAMASHISALTGVHQTTLSRWLSGMNPPKPIQAVSFAKSYGANPVHALIAAGYLEPGDVDMPQPPQLAILDFTDLELALELHRRIHLREDAKP